MKYRVFDKINNWLYQTDEFDERFAIQCNGTVGRFNGKTYDTCTDDVDIELAVGLNDRKENPIYAGDIMKVWIPEKQEEKTGVVRYEPDYGGFIVEWEWSKHQHHILLTCDVAFDGEIIGHIHDNTQQP